MKIKKVLLLYELVFFVNVLFSVSPPINPEWRGIYVTSATVCWDISNNWSSMTYIVEFSTSNSFTNNRFTFVNASSITVRNSTPTISGLTPNTSYYSIVISSYLIFTASAAVSNLLPRCTLATAVSTTHITMEKKFSFGKGYYNEITISTSINPVYTKYKISVIKISTPTTNETFWLDPTGTTSTIQNLYSTTTWTHNLYSSGTYRYTFHSVNESGIVSTGAVVIANINLEPKLEIKCYYSKDYLNEIRNTFPSKSRYPYFNFNSYTVAPIREFKYIWSSVNVSTYPLDVLDNPSAYNVPYYSVGKTTETFITLEVSSVTPVIRLYLNSICLDVYGSSSTMETFTYWYIGISSNPFIEEIEFINSFRSDDIFYNVPQNMSVDITFGGEVYDGKITTASIISSPGCIYIIWKYDQRRELKDTIVMPHPTINYPDPWTGDQYKYWDYDFRATKKINVKADLFPSCEYELVVTKDLQDMIGDQLEKEYRYRFFTVVNSSSTSNLIKPEGAKIELHIPIETFTNNEFVTSRVLQSTETVVSNSISKLPRFQNLLYFLEVRCYDTKHQRVNSVNKNMTLQHNYQDDDNDKILDNTDLSVEELSFWKMDDSREVFIKLPSFVDYDKKIVFAYTKTFGIYALGAKPKFDIEEVLCFPVPWVPESGKTSTGNFSDGITFANLPYNCEICIYTVYGELVRRIEVSNNITGKVQWNGKNDFNEDLASGVYLWVVKTSVAKKTGKLIIIR